MTTSPVTRSKHKARHTWWAPRKDDIDPWEGSGHFIAICLTHYAGNPESLYLMELWNLFVYTFLLYKMEMGLSSDTEYDVFETA